MKQINVLNWLFWFLVIAILAIVWSLAFAQMACGYSGPLSSYDNADWGLLSLRLVDWRQTLDIAGQPDRFTELNPIIGEHPSEFKVNVYFAGLIGLDYIIHRAAENNPERWGRFEERWQKFNYVCEVWCVNNNFNIGAKIPLKGGSRAKLE